MNPKYIPPENPGYTGTFAPHQGYHQQDSRGGPIRFGDRPEVYRNPRFDLAGHKAYDGAVHALHRLPVDKGMLARGAVSALKQFFR